MNLLHNYIKIAQLYGKVFTIYETKAKHFIVNLIDWDETSYDKINTYRHYNNEWIYLSLRGIYNKCSLHNDV